MTSLNMTIDAASAIEALESVVQRAGCGFIYQRPRSQDGTCKYVFNDAGSCGVGQALILLGVPVDIVEGLDTANRGQGIGAHAFAPWLQSKGVHVTPGACSVFAAFQVLQDTGTPWGQALQDARSKFLSLKEA